MSLLHEMAVSAATRRTRVLATADEAPSGYPVIIDLFTINAYGGLEPHLSVTAPDAAAATMLARSVNADAAAVTCRVPPKGESDFSPWVAVHTATPESHGLLATGMSLGQDYADIRTGTIEVREGPSRILGHILKPTHDPRAAHMHTGSTGFLYTVDPYAARPLTGAFYWPENEGFLLTPETEGLEYHFWQVQMSSILGTPGS